MYYCEFTDSRVTVKNENGRLIRTYMPRLASPGGRIVGAQASGDHVIIQGSSGKTVVYHIEGRPIRGGAL